jgi:DNA-nicking Smr family endonuclease
MPSFFRKLIRRLTGGKEAEPKTAGPKATDKAPAAGDSKPAPGAVPEQTAAPSGTPETPAGKASQKRNRKVRGRKKKPEGPPPSPRKGKKKKKAAPQADPKQTGLKQTGSKTDSAAGKAKSPCAKPRPAAPKPDAPKTPPKPAPAAKKSGSAAPPGKSAQPAVKKPAGKPPRRKDAPGKSKPAKAAEDPPVDRHGMPIFSNDTDFEAFFKEEAPPPAPGTPERRPPRPKPENPRPAAPQTNRHGIPVFGKEADLSVYFSEPEADFPNRPAASPSAEDGPDEFERLMESALEGLDRTEMMSRKRDELPPDRRPSLRRRLRDYPPPQAELDLHGFTSAQAAEKTETFLRLSRRRGRRTVLIITGRGIHSDGRPVLPDVVESRIADLRRRKWILASQWERGSKRRSGALIVYLRPPAR